VAQIFEKGGRAVNALDAAVAVNAGAAQGQSVAQHVKEQFVEFSD
jgi:hypothetical protein